MRTAPGGQHYMNFDDVRPMLRALLEDRFRLKAHTADHLADADAFTLYAANPKMKKADPASRTFCKEGPGPDGKDPRIANPILSRLVTCQHITLTQFAAELQHYALDYIKTPVLNLTHLDGGYDLTLSYSDRRSARGVVATPPPGAAPPAPGDASTPSDPNGAISLQDALYKQLGLKLVMEKRPVPMLVIDHLEEKPTDN